MHKIFKVNSKQQNQNQEELSNVKIKENLAIKKSLTIVYSFLDELVITNSIGKLQDFIDELGKLLDAKKTSYFFSTIKLARVDQIQKRIMNLIDTADNKIQAAFEVILNLEAGIKDNPSSLAFITKEIYKRYEFDKSVVNFNFSKDSGSLRYTGLHYIKGSITHMEELACIIRNRDINQEYLQKKQEYSKKIQENLKKVKNEYIKEQSRCEEILEKMQTNTASAEVLYGLLTEVWKDVCKKDIYCENFNGFDLKVFINSPGNKFKDSIYLTNKSESTVEKIQNWIQESINIILALKDEGLLNFPSEPFGGRMKLRCEEKIMVLKQKIEMIEEILKNSKGDELQNSVFSVDINEINEEYKLLMGKEKKIINDEASLNGTSINELLAIHYNSLRHVIDVHPTFSIVEEDQ